MNYRNRIVCLLLIWHVNMLCVPHFKLGVENIGDSFMKRFGGKRFGLITNQTGVDQAGKRTVDILREKKLAIAYLLAPEHGIDGLADAGVAITDTVDRKTGIPVVSLYGHGKGKMVPQQVLDAVDAIIFDIQDSGMRHYTYISTLFRAMQMAAKNNKTMIILDRPNPLGSAMEGPVVESHLKSFISIAHIPLRHGMTVGELAWYFNTYELEKAADLHVVKMSAYDRRYALATPLLQPLSPGLKTIQSCYGYSFLGLLGETGPCGIGLRTDAKFQCIALPKKMKIQKSVWNSLRKKLKTYGIDTEHHEYTDPKTDSLFAGVRLHIHDINKVRSFEALCAVLTFFKSTNVKVTFSRDFDKAVGVEVLRKLLINETEYGDVKNTVNISLQQFFDKAKDLFMYTPAPTVVLME